MNYARFASATYGTDQVAALRGEGWRSFKAPAKTLCWARGAEMVIAFRGTDPADAEDLACDAALLVGQEELQPRFQNSRRYVLNMMRRYPRSALTLVGHSLGGSLALYCMFNTPARAAHTYNAYASPNMIANSVVRASAAANYARCTLHIVYEDPIGMTGAFLVGPDAQYEHVVGTNDPHSINNWAD